VFDWQMVTALAALVTSNSLLLAVDWSVAM